MKQKHPKKPSKQTNKKSSKAKKVLLIAVAVLVAIASVALIGYAIYVNTDAVIDSSVSSEEEELVMFVDADSGFPVSYTSSDIIDVKSFSTKIFAISKRLLTCFNTSGKIEYTWLFGYSDPVIKVSEKYGLIYDRTSTGYLIFNHKGVIFEGSLENTIITAEINNKGDVLFSTKGSNSACKVYLYDKKGEKLFDWTCVKEYVVSLDLSDNSENFLCGGIGSDNGEIYTKIYRLGLYNNDEIASYVLEGSALIDATLCDNHLLVLCSDGRYIMNTKEQSDSFVKAEFSYTVVNYDTDYSGNTAVVTRFSGQSKMKVTLFNKNNEIVCVNYTDEDVINVLCRGKKVYILTDNGVFKSKNDGTFEKEGEQEISGVDMFVCKRKLYCYSDDEINICS